MHNADSRLSLAPAGLVVERVEAGPEGLVVFAHSSLRTGVCPACGSVSGRVHSRYRRALADLPSHGRAVRISIVARRFRCREPACRVRIFTERLDCTIALSSARRTTRLDQIVHQLGLALGGRPAASLARRLMFPVSIDTLLRVVRRHAIRQTETLSVIGIDDWAWKRGHRYGTLICDLERRCIADLLPDREPATVEAWLAARPGIRIIARDRGGGYGGAATRAAPSAVQVADRWHLMENASAERLQYEGFLRHEEANAAIQALALTGTPIKEIVRRTAYSRKTVRKVVRGGRTEMFRFRMSSLEPFLPRLDAEWTAGCHNGAELWGRLKAAGFRGSLRIVTEWATRRRRSGSMAAAHPLRACSARSIARLMTIGRNQLSKSERSPLPS